MPNENVAPGRMVPALQTTKRRNGPSSTGSRAPANHNDKSSALREVPVLVIEDDIPSSRLQGFLLDDAGAEVRVVHSAEEALVALETFHPRIVILDLVLPRMSGLLLVQQLKAEPSTREIAFVAVTSVNGPEAKRMALAAGCSAYIRKPIDVDTFAETVAAVLREKP